MTDYAGMLPAAPGWKSAADPPGSFFGPAMTLSPTASRYDHSPAWFNAMADREAIWEDNQGAEGYRGLTLHIAQPGRPCASPPSLHHPRSKKKFTSRRIFRLERIRRRCI